jgi:hypothetical protein
MSKSLQVGGGRPSRKRGLLTLGTLAILIVITAPGRDRLVVVGPETLPTPI